MAFQENHHLKKIVKFSVLQQESTLNRHGDQAYGKLIIKRYYVLKREGFNYIVETYEEIIKLNEKYNERWIHKNHVFYRGQANSSWDMVPAIKRKENTHEVEIIQKVINCKQIDICKVSLFEYIAYLQHYDYPTRFLDLTTKLDIALYFACADVENKDEDGKLFMFIYEERAPLNKEVIILSELSLLKAEMSVGEFSQQLINNYAEFEEYSNDSQELSMIAISFLDHGFVVLPGKKDYEDMSFYNPRVKQQSGAFFICGNKLKKPLTAQDRWKSRSEHNIILPETNSIPSTLWDPCRTVPIIIPSSLKSAILSIIKEKGITKNYLFPDKSNF